MTLQDAQDQALTGTNYGLLYPALENDEERRLFKAWWLQEPSVPINRIPPPRKLPAVASGNACKTCGGLMVRAGKCEYCPNGCGSEGECS